MTIEEMKAKKNERGLTNEMIAKLSGVPLGTVQKIFSGETKAPRKLTIQSLTRVLSEEWDTGRSCEKAESTLHETAVQYGVPGKTRRYTLDDYYAIPDDRRVELIDGEIYDMASPTFEHQRILGNLYLRFRECAETHGMPCDIYAAPCDVQLDKDNYTMVQPDLLVLCGEYDSAVKRYEGAPDLVAEILSPSTRSKDMLLKLYKYQSAGVREYWIVDPDHKKVFVHFFDTEDYCPEQYDFDSQVPVGISGGAYRIDFTGIADGWRDRRKS